MTLTAPPPGQEGPMARLDAAMDRLAELQGQRNRIDAEIVEIVRILRDQDRWADTGAKSLTACVEWKTGSTRSHARALVAVAERADQFPRCIDGLTSGRFSLDQVALIAQHADEGTDQHYTDVAARPHGQRTTVIMHLDLDT